ncbi:MAG: cytochrome c oxidase subunit II [Chloroflexi bacterium]|nr:cytochrome c oxidase subunit II [Chloroflexota bacterium]MYD48340.1 cytochrome c oxidase subunit II [Chloroflexota bacterium]
MGLLPFSEKDSPTISKAGSGPEPNGLNPVSNASDSPSRRNGRRSLVVLALLGIILMLAALGCDSDAHQSVLSSTPWTLDGANGPVARDQLLLFNVLLWTMVVVFVLVEGALLYAAIRYRRKPGDPLPPQTHGHTPLEIAWTIIPTILILGLGIWSVFVLFKLEPGEAIALAAEQGKEPLHVEAIGHQWWWEFRYENALPDTGECSAPNVVPAGESRDPECELITTANEMRIPVDRPVIMTLKSDDVIHSFWIPKLAGKQDVVPTRDNQMWFLAEDTGMYYGQCAEFCGTAHAQMKFRVHALPEAEYKAWVDGWGKPVDLSTADNPAAAQSGQLVFLGDGQCVTCHTVGSADQVDEVGEGVQHARMETYIAYTEWLQKSPGEQLADVRTGQEPPTAFAAPNLTDLGARTTLGSGLVDLNRETLRQWIRNPDAIKPGNRMSELAAIYQTRPDHRADLTEDQLSDLVEYLMAQK